MTSIPARTALFGRRTGGIITVNDESKQTGNIYWVGSAVTGASDTAGFGFGPDAPFKTLAFAITQCTASQGDRIYIMEGHAEAVIAAGTITLNIAGVSIIGIGHGNERPTFSWTTATTATMLISAANISIENVIFDVSGISALVSGIVISAAGASIKRCRFLTSKAGAGTAPLASILTTAGANNLVIQNNQFIGPALTPTTVSAGTTCITLVGGTGILIDSNWIIGWFTGTIGGIQGLTTLTDNVAITNNFIVNQTSGSTKCIVLLTGSTGVVGNNRFGVLSGAAPITGDAVWWAGNWSAAAVATNGTLV